MLVDWCQSYGRFGRGKDGCCLLSHGRSGKGFGGGRNVSCVRQSQPRRSSVGPLFVEAPDGSGQKNGGTGNNRRQWRTKIRKGWLVFGAPRPPRKYRAKKSENGGRITKWSR